MVVVKVEVVVVAVVAEVGDVVLAVVAPDVVVVGGVVTVTTPPSDTFSKRLILFSCSLTVRARVRTEPWMLLIAFSCSIEINSGVNLRKMLYGLCNSSEGMIE